MAHSLLGAHGPWAPKIGPGTPRSPFFYDLGGPEAPKIETKKQGIYNLKHGSYTYPISYQLIKDGFKNKVLNNPIYSKSFVTMVHGSKDEAVPVVYSRRILKLFKKANKKIRIIKNGDHSLSSKKNIKILVNELDKIVKLYLS